MTPAPALFSGPRKEATNRLRENLFHYSYCRLWTILSW